MGDAALRVAPDLGAGALVVRQRVVGIGELVEDQLLVGMGLYSKEATAMVNTWRDSWFEEGTRVFYIVPEPTVAEILPLSVTPAPVQTVRVFVGRMDVITKSMQEAVEQGISSDNDDVLGRFGRLFEPITDRILERSSDRALHNTIAILKKTAFARYVAASSKCQ